MADTFEIEKHVPLPPPTGRGRPSSYPVAQMEVGDSFFVPETTAKPASVQSTCAKHARRAGITITVRRESGGCRVWRTS